MANVSLSFLNIHMGSAFREPWSTWVLCHSARLHFLILFLIHWVFLGLNCSAIYNFHVKASIAAAAAVASCLDTPLLAVILHGQRRGQKRPFYKWSLIMNCQIHVWDWKLLMRFKFPFQTSSELSECTQSLFSEYLLEWIASKSFSLLQVKRFIKNLRFNVPQETREFDSLGLKACSPAERMVTEIKLALWFWG